MSEGRVYALCHKCNASMGVYDWGVDKNVTILSTCFNCQCEDLARIRDASEQSNSVDAK